MQSWECYSGLSISGEDVSALYLFNTRQFRFCLHLQPARCEAAPSSERMIQAILPRQRSRPDPDGLRLRDLGPEQTAQTRRPSGQCPGRPTSSGLGPRADRPNSAALGGVGAVSRSAYIIATRPTSSGRGPRGISPVGYVPVQAAFPVQSRRRGRTVRPHQELQPRAPSSWPIREASTQNTRIQQSPSPDGRRTAGGP